MGGGVAVGMVEELENVKCALGKGHRKGTVYGVSSPYLV